MNDSSTVKLSSSLEDLSLKKQLPLRQQVNAQKPMLKYSNSSIKPVQLFNHADLVSIRSNADAARNAYSSLSSASSSSTMSTPFRTTVKQHTPQTLLKHATGTTTTSQTAPSSPPSKGHSNPYARPLSAKDIVNDLNSQKMKKSMSSTRPNGQTSGMFSNGGGTGTPMFGFPMNAFMRPQSGSVKNDKTASGKVSQSNTATASKAESKKETINPKGALPKNTPRKMIPPTKLERETDLSQTFSETISEVGKMGGQAVRNQFGPASKPVSKATLGKSDSNRIDNGANTSVTSKGSGSVSSPSKVAAASQTPNSALAKSAAGAGSSANNTTNGYRVLNGTDTASSSSQQPKNVVYARPVSSLPRPGSAASTRSRPDTPTKVRNMNYTPTKPYHEVADPETVVSKPPPSPMHANQTRETAITVKPGNNYMAPTNITKPSEAKYSSSSTTNNVGSSKRSSASSSSTMFYRKETKAEVMLHEQRPPAIGAPAKLARGAEKGSANNLTSGSECDEADAQSETPSGERMPGDGEASLEGDEYDDEDDDEDFADDEDDDMVDDLDDDCIGGSDDDDAESDGYSFTSSSLSRRSSSARKLKIRPFSGPMPAEKMTIGRPQTASPERQARPAFIRSMFPNIPPVIAFTANGEKVDQLPWEMRKYLKWRLSPITPNIVKHCLARSGFRITKRNHDWLGCWGKHMKSPGFKGLREYQKLNHFPGSFQIGRKDRLWRNLSKMQVHFGKKEFGFFPQTYCLPTDFKLLKRAFEDGNNKQKWIIKPPASARGIGIKVINKLTQVPKRRPVIVQRYLSRPYLINESKFDMRIYVYVSSYDPLRLYVFEDGLARFASMKYSSSMKNLSNKFMHLTNYSVNKKNADYQANADETVCQGHKWSLKALWNYMKRQGVNTSVIWESMKDLIVKTIICSDGPVNSLIKANCKSRYCVHELFGFDIMLDESLKPWIIEVNISPSLHSNSQLDVNIKGQMIKDLMNISGIMIPDKPDLTQHPSVSSGPPDLSCYEPSNKVCMDKRLYTQQMAPDEKAKHAYYCQKHQDEQVQQSILDILTPDDVRFLTESIDEDSRKGGFQRIFPTPSTYKYLKYFESPRYYNLLLNQWVLRFNRMEQRVRYKVGISILQALCEDGIHLEINTEHPAHQWNPPNSTCHSYRGDRLLSAPASKHNKDSDASKASASTSSLLKIKRKPSTKTPPASRSISQSSSVSSSINNLVFAPQSTDILSPKGKVPSR